MQVEQTVQVIGDEAQILLAMREGRSAALGFHQALADVGNVLAEREQRLTGDRLAHKVADQKPKQWVALDRGDRGGGPGLVDERFPASSRQRIDGALAGLARLLAGREIAQRCQALRLGVVLALTGPGEHASMPRHPQEVVSPGASAPDQAEYLVGKQCEIVS